MKTVRVMMDIAFYATLALLVVGIACQALPPISGFASMTALAFVRCGVGYIVMSINGER